MRPELKNFGKNISKKHTKQISWHQTSNSPKSAEKGKPKYDKKIIMNEAFEDHKKHLDFLDPILKLLTSKKLFNPAKYLASLVLSNAIMRKNALEAKLTFLLSQSLLVLNLNFKVRKELKTRKNLKN